MQAILARIGGADSVLHFIEAPEQSSLPVLTTAKHISTLSVKKATATRNCEQPIVECRFHRR